MLTALNRRFPAVVLTMFTAIVCFLTVYSDEARRRHFEPYPAPYSYVCNLTSYPSLPSSAFHTLPSGAPSELAHAAAILQTLVKHTAYTHVSEIDPRIGLFETDCSCLVSYLLHTTPSLAGHLEDIPKETHDPAVNPPMPRAWDYAHFIQGLNGTSNPRWKAVDSVRDLQAGDLVAWEIPGWNVTGKSTGHVVIVAPPPSKAPGHEGRMIVPDGERSVWVGVLDASSVRHRWDTRCGWGGDEGVISRTCLGGVGHAFIRLLMDAKGRPVAFQFHEQAVVRNYPISLARLSDEREKPAVPFAS